MTVAPDTHPNGWPIKELWEKYEDVAMHFNDLLIRLRMQALGVVAALSTLVGIFTKTDTAVTWEIASLVFAGLAVFWIAIWILDFSYYNRLLVGAVAAILVLEDQSTTADHIKTINVSTMITDAVTGTTGRNLRPTLGIWCFYSMAFLALVFGFAFCLDKHLNWL